MAASPTHRRTSTQADVADGLLFLQAFQHGDIDACLEMLHPDIEWHPSPSFAPLEVRRGREEVRIFLDALYDRFANGLEVQPDHGRQVGNHMLLITVLRASNWFNDQPVRSRECWLVTLRDNLWVRVVSYPNAAAARLAFEELTAAVTPLAE